MEFHMSKNINQIFIANPITSNAMTDLMYFGQSPYGVGNDAAMTFSNFSAQFGAPYTAAALTKTDDTNVTLTLGGTPATALLHAASLTLGWTGQLGLTRGGSNASLTASNGGIIYSTATAMAVLSGTATANLPLLSGATAAPSWGAFALSLGGTLTTAGALTTVGAFGAIFTFTNTTSVTFPTSGTLATTAQLLASPLTTKGDIWVWTTTNARLAVGTVDGQILQVSSGAASGLAYSTPTYPSVSGTAGKILRSDATNNVYSTSTFADTYAVSTLLYASGTNAVTGLATANSAALVTSGAGVPAWQTLTAGQILVGTTASAPAATTISSGTGITVTSGSGSISIALTGGASGTLTWNDVAGTTQAAAVNNGYIISNAGQTTVSLPATAAEGSVFAVQGKGAAGWILQANTGQVIHLGSSATSSAGSLTSTNLWDSVTIVCVTANTTFAVTSVIGNLTVA